MGSHAYPTDGRTVAQDFDHELESNLLGYIERSGVQRTGYGRYGDWTYYVWWLAEEDDGSTIAGVTYMSRHQGWSHFKHVPETMGPGLFDIPEKFFEKLGPESHGTYSDEWRTQVREKRAA